MTKMLTRSANISDEEFFDSNTKNVGEIEQSVRRTKSSNFTEDIDIHSEDHPPVKIVWRNVAIFVYLHAAAFYGLYALIVGQVMWQTVVFASFTLFWGSFGVTAGSHRLWAHKSYKAKFPLRFILAILQTVALQNSVWEWSRDHRVHHKYSETHADPHNAKRGFFFSHMGWLMCNKHPAVKIKGKHIDMSDLEADPVVMFQHKYYYGLAPLFCFIIPAYIPWHFWEESVINGICFAAMFRYTLSLHFTWLINSAAHLYGTKPYDRNIGPVESSVAFLGTGEGWHNYHHTFPWDYKAAEFGGWGHNSTAVLIEYFAKIGWAYDLKSVPEHIVKQRMGRTGDGTHPGSDGVEGHRHIECGPYAWGDKDIPTENVAITQTLYGAKGR